MCGSGTRCASVTAWTKSTREHACPDEELQEPQRERHPNPTQARPWRRSRGESHRLGWRPPGAPPEPSGAEAAMACPGSLQKTVPPPWEQPRAGAEPRGAAQMQQPPTSRGPQWEPDMARGPSSGAYAEALRLSQNGYSIGGLAWVGRPTHRSINRRERPSRAAPPS
jgi:hypothetical protein